MCHISVQLACSLSHAAIQSAWIIGIFPLRSLILQRWTAQLIERYRSIAIIIQNQAVKL